MREAQGSPRSSSPRVRSRLALRRGGGRECGGTTPRRNRTEPTYPGWEVDCQGEGRHRGKSDPWGSGLATAAPVSMNLVL